MTIHALETVRGYDTRHVYGVFIDNMVVRYEFVLHDELYDVI